MMIKSKSKIKSKILVYSKNFDSDLFLPLLPLAYHAANGADISEGGDERPEKSGKKCVRG